MYIPQCHSSKVRSVFILTQSLPTLQSDKVDMAASESNTEELKQSLCCHLNNPQELLWQLNYVMLLVAFMTSVGLCIVIYFYSKTNQRHNISNLFYFGTTLYMFRTVFPSFIRSTYNVIPCRFCGCLLASSHRTCMT